MSRETESMFRALHKYIEDHSDENRTEAETKELINDFMAQYNSHIPEPITEDTAESAEDYLELAFNADNRKDALKYAKEALKRDPYNFDAEKAVIDLKAKDDTRLVMDYAKAVRKATKYMEEEGFFEEDCIGSFWGLLETRPYMRLRAGYVEELLNCGMIRRAQEECEELLRLCEDDNLGLRYRLMHIYAYLEDEEAALALHRQFDSYNETQMLLPLSILYYKKCDYTKSAKYLRKLHGSNKDLKRFLKFSAEERIKEILDFELKGGYRPGSIDEFLVEWSENDFLFMSLDSYMEWALQQVKKFK